LAITLHWAKACVVSHGVLLQSGAVEVIE
jgi:hypothetical protein